MFVELIESLRCPRPHEPSPLVASAVRVVARHIVDGVLGCPVCGSEFRITEGIAYFDAMPTEPRAAQASDDEAMRLAAFLELPDARGFALLCGTWAVHAERLRPLTDAPVVFVNAPRDAPNDVAAGVIVTGDVLPFAPSSARAAALDARMSAPLIESTVRAVRARGRVVGPADLAVPAGVAEITRDARTWVGEKSDVPNAPLVALARAKS